MRSALVLQPFVDDQALVEVLQDALANEAFESFTAVVAWARPSGLQHLTDSMSDFAARGGQSEIVVGIDEGGASVEGLEMARDMFAASWVLYDHAGGTFHPKIYLFRGPHEALVVVGSNNLTSGGLYFNYEAAHVAALDLALAPDVEVLETVEDYVARLKADDTCIELTKAVIDALASDARFRVSRESERKRSPKAKDDSVPETPDDPVEGLFGTTRYKRKAFKLKAPASKPKPGSKPVVATTSVEAGGSTADVVARWTKKLTRSDCGQPRAGSNTTGALRFTKAGHPIRQATWFRQVLFSDAEWLEDPSRPGRERASIRFDVQIYGAPLGTHVLALKYDAERDAGQNNFTTDLKWGSLTQAIRAQDLVDSYIVVERLADATFRLSIESHEPKDFVDELSI